MDNLLIKLMLITTLSQLGISLLDFATCTSKACLRNIEKRSRDILKIDWKPISVFPDEAKKFK